MVSVKLEHSDTPMSFGNTIKNGEIVNLQWCEVYLSFTSAFESMRACGPGWDPHQSSILSDDQHCVNHRPHARL